MRKHFEDWQHKRHEAEILELYKNGKGLNASAIARTLKEKYGLKEKQSHLERLFRKFIQWAKAKLLNRHHAKILIYDIETAPLKAYVWRCWKQNIHPLNGQLLTESWFMLTWSAKWLFEDKVMSARLKPKEALAEDDSRIVKILWDLFDEADIIIGHNCHKFDNKQSNTRFLKYGMNPPSSYQTIDTYLHAKKQFSMPSNKLDFIANFLGVGRKIETNFGLWANCLKGDKAALQEMERYNIQDVQVTEEVYLKMRPYIKPHPNLGLFIEENVQVCPTCSSSNLKWTGSYATYANLYDEFKCRSCGANGRSRKASMDTEAKRFLTSSLPR